LNQLGDYRLPPAFPKLALTHGRGFLMLKFTLFFLFCSGYAQREEDTLNLFSHGAYSIYAPVAMGDDNKTLFKRVLQGFLDKYSFALPDLLTKPAKTT
jgi:hypothetical protein